jgi:hypothetical protein
MISPEIPDYYNFSATSGEIIVIRYFRKTYSNQILQEKS